MHHGGTAQPNARRFLCGPVVPDFGAACRVEQRRLLQLHSYLFAKRFFEPDCILRAFLFHELRGRSCSDWRIHRLHSFRCDQRRHLFRWTGQRGGPHGRVQRAINCHPNRDPNRHLDADRHPNRDTN